jgi:hypothetical protein
MSPPGFTFWGLFVACALLIAGYGAWMIWVERDR